jgi:hypothetical protein
MISLRIGATSLERGLSIDAPSGQAGAEARFAACPAVERRANRAGRRLIAQVAGNLKIIAIDES